MVLDRQIVDITPDHPRYPASLRNQTRVAAFQAAGPLDLLDRPSTGFFCSAQCPGAVILKTFDAITALRDQRELVIGGFHSPMEWDCFGILLRGSQPVIWVPARNIQGMRLSAQLRPAFAADRLLILSPFESKQRRITADLAEERNRFVATLGSRIFAAHAAPSSRTLALCEELLREGKPVITIDDPANRNLLGMLGVRPLSRL